MGKGKNNYQDVLQEFFYPENDIHQKVVSGTQMSLVDALAIKNSWSDIHKFLENWKLPSEYLYLAWADIYNKNCYSINSPYHVVSALEGEGLLQNAERLDSYLWSTLIDIWCGNWAKPASLLKYMKSIGLGTHIKKYMGLDGSESMLKATEDIFSKANIPNLEYELGKQRFQELNVHTIEWKKTFMFLWWSLWTYSNQKEWDEFLQELNDTMGKDDTFVTTVFTLPEESTVKEISDEELKQLQQRFITAERERYERNNLWEREKQIAIENLKQIGVDAISAADFDTYFFFDEGKQKLIDKKTFTKDIKIGWDIIFPKWFTLESPGTLLDKSFFQPTVEKKVKDFTDSIYNTNQSSEFVLNFFAKYLQANTNEIAYKAEWNDHTHTMEICIECLQDTKLYIQDEVIAKKKWDKIMIHSSHRFSQNEIENLSERNNFEIIDTFKIWWMIDPSNTLFHEELMKIYILKKK